MAKTVIALEATMNASGAEGSVKSLKAQLREAQADVATMADKFGLTSDAAQKAAKKAAELKDAIGDAKLLTDAFNPDAKFKSFSNAISGVVGGFSALQGAQALFGDQSEDLAKTLAKVQGAMALSQGINSVLEAKDAFKVLSGVIKTNVITSLTTLRGALIATGIGALAVGVGLLVANFDKVKEAVLNFIPGLKSVTDYVGKLINKITDFIGVTSDAKRAQESFIKDTEKQIKKTDEFLDSQGYKYDEFTQRKIKANLEYKKHELELANDKTRKEGETQALLKAYRDKADYEIRQADADRLAKNQENINKRQKQIDDAAANEKNKRDQANEKKKQDDIDFYNKLDNVQNELGKAREDRQIANANNFNNTLKLLGENRSQNEIAEANRRVANAEAETIMKRQLISIYADALGSLSQLVGAQTAVGKGLAIAQIAIGTATGYIQGLEIAQKSAKATGPGAAFAFPIFYATQIAAVLGAAAKAKSVLSGVKGGGNLNLPSPPPMPTTAAPIGPQMGSTALQQAQINAAGSAAVQAFVLESDVSGNQERIERLNRAARIK
jgi:hypothetical protein